MKIKALFLFLLLSLARPAGAVDVITRWLVFTNAPLGNTNSVTLNASTRTYTNTPSGSPATLIQQTNSIPYSATNTANQLTSYKVSTAHTIGVGTNYLTVRGGIGENLTLSVSAGFGFVTNSTQTVSSPTFVVRVPMTTEAASNQVSIGSLLVKGMSDSSTNAFGTNSTATSNHITKGASPRQHVASPITLNGGFSGVLENITNGYGTNQVFDSPQTTNLVNRGNAIRSEGSGGNSLQVGSNALSSGTRAVALGVNSTATNTDALAVGTGTSAAGAATALGNGTIASGNNSTASGSGAFATGSGATANGNLAGATGLGSIAIGQAPQATKDYSIAIGNEDTLVSGTNSIAIGLEATASGYRGTALGPGAAASYDFSTALGGYDYTGTAASASDTNQVRLGTGNQRVSIPGQLLVSGSQSNTTFRGTNVINGRVDFTPRNNTGLANGNNAGVVLGTNTYVRLSGATTIAYLGGFAAEQDGSFHILRISGSITNTFGNESGVDATAANRIVTGTGGDLSYTNNPLVIGIIYDGTTSRWNLMGVYR